MQGSHLAPGTWQQVAWPWRPRYELLASLGLHQLVGIPAVVYSYYSGILDESTRGALEDAYSAAFVPIAGGSFPDSIAYGILIIASYS